MAQKSIEMCDEDLRTNLYGNIVLAGGTSLMSGFTERFEDEIRKYAAKSPKQTDIIVTAALHRKNAAWIGGSMLASMSTFADNTIRQGEFLEVQPDSDRPQLILKKSLYWRNNLKRLV